MILYEKSLGNGGENNLSLNWKSSLVEVGSERGSHLLRPDERVGREEETGEHRETMTKTQTTRSRKVDSASTENTMSRGTESTTVGISFPG